MGPMAQWQVFPGEQHELPAAAVSWTYSAGAASNFVSQPVEQKYQVSPP